jgi:hypothetical protein
MTLLCVELQMHVRATFLHPLHTCKQSCSNVLKKFRIITPKSASVPVDPLPLAANRLKVVLSTYFIPIINFATVLYSYFSTSVLKYCT